MNDEKGFVENVAQISADQKSESTAVIAGLAHEMKNYFVDGSILFQKQTIFDRFYHEFDVW